MFKSKRAEIIYSCIFKVIFCIQVAWAIIYKDRQTIKIVFIANLTVATVILIIDLIIKRIKKKREPEKKDSMEVETGEEKEQ